MLRCESVGLSAQMLDWAAVKELILSYYFVETISITKYNHHGN